MTRCLFVTGKLAARSLRDVLEKASSEMDHALAVLPISVAALMDTKFIAKHLTNAEGCDQVMIPGLCKGDPGVIEQKLGVKVILGPKSLKDVPACLGMERQLEGYGAHRVKIFAEIVDAYKLHLDEILNRAAYFKDSGADIIDLGCTPEEPFSNIDRVVRELKARGYLVSVDSNDEDNLKRTAGFCAER
jgi:hypothetical protein